MHTQTACYLQQRRYIVRRRRFLSHYNQNIYKLIWLSLNCCHRHIVQSSPHRYIIVAPFNHRHIVPSSPHRFIIVTSFHHRQIVTSSSLRYIIVTSLHHRHIVPTLPHRYIIITSFPHQHIVISSKHRSIIAKLLHHRHFVISSSHRFIIVTSFHHNLHSTPPHFHRRIVRSSSHPFIIASIQHTVHRHMNSYLLTKFTSIDSIIAPSTHMQFIFTNTHLLFFRKKVLLLALWEKTTSTSYFQINKTGMQGSLRFWAILLVYVREWGLCESGWKFC